MYILGEVLREFQCSGSDDVGQAVSSARQAQKTWRQKSGFERGQVLKQAADLIRVYTVFVLISAHAPISSHPGRFRKAFA